MFIIMLGPFIYGAHIYGSWSRAEDARQMLIEGGTPPDEIVVYGLVPPAVLDDLAGQLEAIRDLLLGVEGDVSEIRKDQS